MIQQQTKPFTIDAGKRDYSGRWRPENMVRDGICRYFQIGRVEQFLLHKQSSR
jgi:hypothetical protein